MAGTTDPVALPQSHRARARALSAGAGKSNGGAPGYSRWVNRPLGRQLAVLAFQAGLTPNHVTVVSGLTTLTGIVVLALAPPTVLVGLVVAALLVLGYALDSADGQLARMRGGGSRTGEWLDHIFDCVKIATLHVAVLLSWYAHFDLPAGLLLVPLVFGAQLSIYFFGKVLSDLLRPTAAGAGEPGRSRVVKSLLGLPVDYGVLCLVFATLGFHRVFVGLYSAMALCGVLLLALALPKWYRDLARAERSAAAPPA